MKLINKDALLKEIERRIKTNKECMLGLRNLDYYQGKVDALNDAISFLDSLEVKEVDYDKEVTEYLKNFENANIGHRLSLRRCAKHFFEFGLQAQHDNWKVVDNTNLPQEDKTKIYCVFTKQRYILAKVISNPQDEDLLQWKCTEFPNYRYDMCEGDKYMQIV